MSHLAVPYDYNTGSACNQSNDVQQHADKAHVEAHPLGGGANALDHLNDEGKKQICGYDRDGPIRMIISGEQANLLAGEVPGHLIDGQDELRQQKAGGVRKRSNILHSKYI